jgi:ligand-binding SRPBCC domain-containing protein
VPPTLPIPRPKPSIIERSIEIDCPVEKLFRFHRDTRNAPRVSPGVSFDSIDGEFPLQDGGIVTIVMRQKPIPFPLTWKFRVEAVVPNRAVVDVAIASPFKAWRHEHRFESLGPDRCRLTDRITYTPPFGPLGAIGDRVFVNRMLQKTFEQRQILTKRLMETS